LSLKKWVVGKEFIVKLSMMKETLWQYVENATIWLVCGILMLLSLCQVVILGPLWLFTKGWSRSIRCVAKREIDMAFAKGYDMGLRHMDNPPCANSTDETIEQQVEEIMKGRGL